MNMSVGDAIFLLGCVVLIVLIAHVVRHWNK
jgi:hypothetical protein